MPVFTRTRAQAVTVYERDIAKFSTAELRKELWKRIKLWFKEKLNVLG